MKKNYTAVATIRCRVPAPSVGFGEGEWVEFAGQFLGKGTSRGDETRRGRIAASAGMSAAVTSAVCRKGEAQCRR